jgi:hypothetical protein
MSFDRRKFSIINDDKRLVVALAPFWQSHKYATPTQAIKIRRSGDNAVADFGFNPNNEFDTAAAKAWIDAGGGSQEGFCDTLYDQSNFNNKINQATTSRQPNILFDQLGGNSDILSLDVSPVASYLINFPLSENVSGDYTFFIIIKTPSVVNSGILFEGIFAGNFTRVQYRSDRKINVYDQSGHVMGPSSIALDTDTYYILSVTIKTPAASSTLHINGTQRASTNDFTGGIGGLSLGAISGGSLNFIGQIPAFYLFKGAFDDTERQNVETELNQIYNIH